MHDADPAREGFAASADWLLDRLRAAAPPLTTTTYRTDLFWTVRR